MKTVLCYNVRKLRALAKQVKFKNKLRDMFLASSLADYTHL